MNVAPMFSIAFILFVWLFTYIALSGLGILSLKCLRIPTSSYFQNQNMFWLGWVFCIVTLQVWHIFFPVNVLAIFLISILGFFGFSQNLKKLIKNLKIYCVKSKCYWAIIFLLAIILANQARRYPLDVDSTTYHMNVIRWYSSYPVVPGIANLHVRLAYNNTNLLYSALYDHFKYSVNHFPNGLILLVFLSQVISGMWRSLFISKRPDDLFIALLLIPSVRQVFGYSVSSPTPTLVIYVLRMLLSYRLIKILFEMNLNKLHKWVNLRSEVIFVVLISLIGITVKLSFLFQGIATLILVMIIYFKAPGLQKKIVIKSCVLFFILIGLVMIPWLLRNIIMSGYLIFPSLFGAVDVDWRIPKASVGLIIQGIFHFARTDSLNLGKNSSNLEWLVEWFRYAMTDNVFVLSFIIIIGCMLIHIFRILIRRNQTFYRKNPSLYLFFIPLISAVVYWAFTAPSMRFLSSLPVIMCASLCAIEWNDHKDMRKVLLFVSIGITIIWFFGLAPLKSNYIFTGPGNQDGFYNRIQTRHLKKFNTVSGTKIYYSGYSLACWDMIPCATKPNLKLELRELKNLRKGFKTYPFDDLNTAVGF